MGAFLWLGIALACYFIAKAKNRRGWLWLILGICFSYVTLIILLFKKKVTPVMKGNAIDVRPVQQQDVRKEKKCPHCAETVLVEAKVCKHCGRDFVNPAASKLQQAGEVKSERVITHVPPAPPVANLLDLNTATEDELAELPGISSILAKKAITIRDSKDGFSSIEEFGQELGLSELKFERLKPLIKVTTPSNQIPSYAGRGRTVDF